MVLSNIKIFIENVKENIKWDIYLQFLRDFYVFDLYQNICWTFVENFLSQMLDLTNSLFLKYLCWKTRLKMSTKFNNKFYQIYLFRLNKIKLWLAYTSMINASLWYNSLIINTINFLMSLYKSLSIKFHCWIIYIYINYLSIHSLLSWSSSFILRHQILS